MGMKKRPFTRSTKHTSSSTSETIGDRVETRRNGPRLGADLPFPYTIAGLLAYLHTALYILFQYLRKGQEAGQVYFEMALGSWFSSAKEDEDGPQMKEMALKEKPTGVVKRRRHKAEGRAGSKDRRDDAVYYPGMVNLSGTLCYMNSVLQAFASITSLLTHLEKIVNLAVDVDLPTPVADALLETLYDLNTPQKRQPPALRPVALLHALQTLPAIRRLLSTREQQDAHELFLVLAEAVSDEAVKVAAEVAVTRGFGEILSLQGYIVNKSSSSTTTTVESGRLGQDGGRGTRAKKRGLAMPWEGLMARRRVCKTCGGCESIRMDTLGGMELAIPLNGDVSVENCIAQYLAPELLSDVTCEMCSLRQTLAHYTIDAERLSSPSSSITTNTHTKSSASSPSTPETKSGSFSALENVRPNTNGLEENKGKAMTSSRKKRAKEAKRTEVRLQQMLESGTITHFGESYIPSLSKEKEIGSVVPVKWQIARTDSIREAAITRPPQSLRLHFIRSEYTPYGQLLKKSARVAFPLILDLTRFVANGVWEERNVLGMLGAGTDKNSNQTGTNTETNQEPQTKVLYRLESVILHYGYTHSSGHYICIRRKPRNGQINDISNRPEQVCKSCPDGCRCDACCWYGQVRPTESRGAQGEGEGEVRGKGWLRISDADVDEVGVEALIDARAAVFMVFYEKVGEYKGEGKGVVAERNEVEQERER